MNTEVLERTRTSSEERNGKDVVVLLSGGIDSTVLLYSLIEDYRCWPLTINYGQRHSKEIISARNVCEARGEWLLKRWKYLDLGNLRFILPSALTGVGEVPSGEYDKKTMSQTLIPNRNMIFLAIASGYAEGLSAECITYAAHTEDHYLYPDTRPEFVDSVRETIKLGTGGKVKLLAPFIGETKADIVALGKKLVVPFRLTWSCYVGGDLHCGLCSTCVERREAFKKANVRDPTVYANKQETLPLVEEVVLCYKEFYNKERGLPEPKWGIQLEGLQCSNCNSWEMFASADPDDPEEIIGVETVRCGHCGQITDYYEAHKQRENHPTEEVREVVR